MKKATIIGILISVILMSCGKTGGTVNANVDNTTAWEGTYTGTISGTNNVNRVVVTRVNNTTVQMDLQINYGGTFYTFAKIQNATLTSTTSASVNENGVIYGYTDTYHFAGSAVQSGNNLSISGKATSTTNASDVKLYGFSGVK